jgi:hypothetical protein
MTRKRKIWIGIGAFVLAGSAASQPAPASASDGQRVEPTQTKMHDGMSADLRRQIVAQALTVGQGGAGGEGGEGGEAGINVEAAAKDPVEYGVALQVIAAHYYAGLAAYAGKEREAGAQMFAHGLSEVYVAMEEVFKSLGVTDLGPKLEAAVTAAAEKKPVDEVKRRAGAVFAALGAAERKAPKSAISAQAVRARVTAELIDRAAAQYALSQKDNNLEVYLDGLGFAMAARAQARSVLGYLKAVDRKKEAAMRQALALVGQAYPGLNRPAEPKVKPTDLQVAASTTKLAMSSLQ